MQILYEASIWALWPKSLRSESGIHTQRSYGMWNLFHVLADQEMAIIKNLQGISTVACFLIKVSYWMLLCSLDTYNS